MLSAQDNSPQAAPVQAPRSTAHLLSGIRAFIAKNKAIPAFFKTINESPDLHQPLLEKLIEAIQKADMTNEIFSHPHCMPYLLYLLEYEHKRLPFWSGVTAYHYLIALSQFTDKQHLKIDDTLSLKDGFSVRDLRTVKMVTLIDRDRMVLSTEGIIYFNHTKYQFKLLGITLDENEFLKFLLALPLIEQNIMQVSNYEAMLGKYEVDTFLIKVRQNVPFFRDLNANIFNLPSASMINYFLAKTSPRPMQMKPLFGKISVDTLHELHVANEHPIAWYSLLVKDTLNGVHDYHCGPFVVVAHDIGHCFWASWLDEEDRNIINHVLIPKLRELQASYQHHALDRLVNKFCESLTDYDLTAVTKYSLNTTRFCVYVGECLHRSLNHVNLNIFEASHVLNILILLRELAVGNIAHDTKYNFWSQLCTLLDTRYKHILRPFTKSAEDSIEELERTATRTLSQFSLMSRAPSKGDNPTSEPEQKKYKPE